jgi:hydroxymethylpyrimidine/phosphomethylpyrimidine kinase
MPFTHFPFDPNDERFLSWKPSVALTIGGSDPTGGAGIQADLKTFQHFGIYGLSAITAVTVQDTSGVFSINPVSAQLVAEQLAALGSDIEFGAVKVGMLPSADIVRVVADFLRHTRCTIGVPVVLDPIIASSNGVRFLDEDAIEVMKAELFPRMAIVTPNLPEITAFTGIEIKNEDSMLEAVLAFRDLRVSGLLLKGGHAADSNEARDLFYWCGETEWLSAPRIPKNVHGTGCLLSSAIASGMTLDKGLRDVVIDAKKFITEMIGRAKPIGGGQEIFDYPPFSLN